MRKKNITLPSIHSTFFLAKATTTATRKELSPLMQRFFFQRHLTPFQSVIANRLNFNDFYSLNTWQCETRKFCPHLASLQIEAPIPFFVLFLCVLRSFNTFHHYFLRGVSLRRFFGPSVY